MRPTRLPCVALLSLVLSSAAPAAARGVNETAGYVDLLTTEASGELRSQQYDAYRSRDGNDVFIGNQRIDRGTLLAAGLGMRAVFVLKRGLRISGEGSLQGGPLVADVQPWAGASTVMRAELLFGVGYQFVLGPLALHAAGILGADYMSFKVAPPLGSVAEISLTSASSSSASPLGDEISLRRWGMRLGAQAGVHLQLSKLTALYSDVTFDYDGQWRTRFGIAFGEPGHR